VSRRTPVGGLEILRRRSAELVRGNLSADEQARFCIRGARNQCLVALDDRLMIVKRGARAGATFGGVVTTIYYGDVDAMLIRTSLRMAWLEFSSGTLEASHGRGSLGPESRRDRFTQPNCLPLRRRHLDECRAALEEIRTLVAASKTRGSESADRVSGAALAEIERLAQLRLNGGLSDKKFAAAALNVLRSARRGARAA
jgi:hypothetical protein